MTSSSPVPVSAGFLLWGDALATTLSSWPALAHELRVRGLDSDPTVLIQTIKHTVDNPDDSSKQISQALNSMFNTLNNASISLRDDAENANQALNVAMESLNKQTAEIQRSDHQLQTAKAQINALNECNILLKDLSKLTHTANTRRLSKDPPPFDGKEKHIETRQEQYLIWKDLVNLNFVKDPHIFTSERDQLLHICELLTGDAQTYNNGVMKAVMASTDHTTWPYQTATDFFKALDKQYATLDLSRSASMKFDACLQGKRPFQNFLAQLRVLGRQCHKTDEQMVEALKKKVSDNIQQKLSGICDRPAVDNFEAWADKCQVFYLNQVEYEHNRQYQAPIPHQQPRHAPAHTTATIPTPASTPVQAADYGDPMQLDAFRGQHIDRDTCIAQSLCFYCKESGHGIEGCNKKKQADARRAAYRLLPIRPPQTQRSQYQTPHSPPTQVQQHVNPSYQPYAFTRGRGGYRGGFRGGWTGGNNQFRVHQIEGGFIDTIDSDITSPTPSDSISQVSNQGKE